MFYRKAAPFFLVLLIIIAMVPVSVAYAKEPAQTWEEKYKDEPYVMLKKERVIRINKDYTYSDTFYTKASIQKEEGKSLGEIKLGYDQSRQELKDIEAYTTTPDGKRLRYEKIQDLSGSGNNAVYSDDRIKIISMPGVVKGSLIEWKATQVVKKPMIENHFFEHFHFTYDSFPVKDIKVTIITPKNMTLFFKKLNTEIEPKIEDAGNEVVYTWEWRDGDKVRMEEFMPPSEEVQQIVFVSTLGDWMQLSDWAWNLFQKNLIITPELKRKVREITDGRTSVSEKVQAIIEYIRGEFRYVSMNMDYHNYEPHPISEIFANKYGDCKDHTLLAMAMLKEIGVEARPAFISSNVEIRQDGLLPMPFYFDHVFLLIELEGKQYYTDVLRKGYRYQAIPYALAGRKVFIVNERGGLFAAVPAAGKDETISVARNNVAIRNDGVALIDLDITFSLGLSTAIQEQWKTLNAEMKERLLASIEQPMAMGGKILSKNWKNVDVPYTKMAFTMQVEHPSWVQHVGPMMIFGLPQIQRSALFTAPSRLHPIVFRDSLQLEQYLTYTLPEGYEILELPKKISLETPFADYVREYVPEKNKIVGKEATHYRSANIPAKEYGVVQNFFDEITKMTNSKIVITKIKENK